MIDIEIDGKPLKAPQGSMIIEVADDNGISIPRFCYHKKLSVAANCRMCLVEVEKVGKPLPACATPVTPNMKVFTKSPKAIDAQRAVMEFLLINHPLDCPICDQGGQCELQDNSLTYGRDQSEYAESKRVVLDKDIGPLIATDLTRCIQCTRCVRFGQEIAGLRELGALGRGENMHIGTFVEKSLVSEISANIIDLCPVGALTSKPFRFTARPWELQQHSSISPHDCLGTNLYIHTRNGDVMRVVPQENEAINETWITDRDRYSYTALKSPERLQSPMLKIDGVWQQVDWSTALAKVAEQLTAICRQHGPDALAALAAPISSSEELYLLAKIWEHFNAKRIDHRLKALDQRDQAVLGHYLGTNTDIAALENCQTALIIGSHLHQELPLAATRLRKAALQGAAIHSVNPDAYAFNFPVASDITARFDTLVTELQGIVKAVLAEVPADAAAPFEALNASWQAITPTAPQQRIASELLKAGGDKVIVLGQLADHHPDAALLRALTLTLCHLSQASYFMVSDGANTSGGDSVHHIGAHPHQPYSEWVDSAAKAYVLLHVEPDLDCAKADVLTAQLQQAECVVAISAFDSASLRETATVLLPAACFGETSGSFINIEGRSQSFAAAVAAPFDSRPAWKILRVLGNLLEIFGFDYVGSDDVGQELGQALAKKPLAAAQPTAEQLCQLLNLSLTCPAGSTTLYSDWAPYSIDNIVRRAEPLQQAATQPALGLYINATTAKRLGTQTQALAVVIDANIPDNAGFVPAGYDQTASLRTAAAMAFSTLIDG